MGDIDVVELAAHVTGQSKVDFVHLDPDLHVASLATRHPAWQPSYGQNGGAQGHLRKQRVSVGDLFLFYGRFRPMTGPPWRNQRHPEYENGDFQAVWGWLRIGEIVDLRISPPPIGNSDHPHCHGSWKGENVLYIGAKSLGFNGFEGITGAGILPALYPITRRGGTASQWAFPRTWFSRHRQEHVADCEATPRALDVAICILQQLQDATLSTITDVEGLVAVNRSIAKKDIA